MAFTEETMGWLRDHFFRFVYPAFLAAEHETTRIGPPIDPKAPDSAPKHLPTELRKLWGLCQEHYVPWSYDIREHIQWGSSGGFSVFRETSQLHSRILRNTLSSAVAAMRLEGCTKLMLGGRDVWTLAVIAERRRVPYLFVPELSRKVSECYAVKDFLISRGFTGDELFVDTGFVGSIPDCLAKHFGRTFKFRLISQRPKYPLGSVSQQNTDKLTFTFKETVKDGEPVSEIIGFHPKGKVPRPLREMLPKRILHPNQLFPNRKNARAEALETEYLAKYWKTGTLDTPYEDGFAYLCPKWEPPKTRVTQYFATRQNIQRAALLTSMLWRGVDSYVPRGESTRTTTPREPEQESAW